MNNQLILNNEVITMKKPLSEMTLEELWELFPIILKPHNAEYKEWYSTEKPELIKALGEETIKRMNHIGSTSVEGLIAKPTVDILLEVGADCNVEQLKSNIENAGWICMSSEANPYTNLVFNKGYTPEGFAEKVFHLHVRNLGDWDELYFRDYLIAHRDITKEYGELKQGLKEHYEHNRDGYTQAKTMFIKKYTKAAKEEFGDRYIPR
jgi:GrpB-like predicted nucleotidyltransferase (UPF0157 family)